MITMIVIALAIVCFTRVVWMEAQNQEAPRSNETTAQVAETEAKPGVPGRRRDGGSKLREDADDLA